MTAPPPTVQPLLWQVWPPPSLFDPVRSLVVQAVEIERDLRDLLMKRFIDQAESIGDLPVIGKQVFRQLIEEVTDYQYADQGSAAPNVPIPLVQHNHKFWIETDVGDRRYGVAVNHALRMKETAKKVRAKQAHHRRSEQREQERTRGHMLKRCMLSPMQCLSLNYMPQAG